MYNQNISQSNVSKRGVKMVESAFTNEDTLQHTEKNSLVSMWGSTGKSIYLGLIKTLHDLKQEEVPLLAETEFKDNVIYTDILGQELTFSREVVIGCPKYVRNFNDVTVQYLGKNNGVFYIGLDRGDYVEGDILSYDRYNGKDMYICGTPQDLGGVYKIPCKLTSGNTDDYIPNGTFVNQMPFYKIGTIAGAGEFTTGSSRITNTRTRKLENYAYYTSNHIQSVSHEVTGHACISSFEIPTLQGRMEDVSKYLTPENPYAVTNFYTYLNQTAGKDDISYPQIENGSLAWIPTIFKNLTVETAKMMQATLTWQKGGFVMAGGQQIRLGRGLWEQLKDGYYSQYSDPKILPYICEQFMSDLFAGIGNIVPPEERYFEFETGMGGLIEFRKYFKQYFDQSQNILYNAKDFEGMLSGTVRDMSYKPIQFTSVLIPHVGWIKPVHNPAFDYRQDNPYEMPMYGQYPRMSYSVIVKNITQNTSTFKSANGIKIQNVVDNGANIALIRPRGMDAIVTSYQVGALAPKFLQMFVNSGGASGNVSTFGDKTGFKVTQHFVSEILVKNPKNTLCIEFMPSLDTRYR